MVSLYQFYANQQVCTFMIYSIHLETIYPAALYNKGFLSCTNYMRSPAISLALFMWKSCCYHINLNAAPRYLSLQLKIDTGFFTRANSLNPLVKIFNYTYRTDSRESSIFAHNHTLLSFILYYAIKYFQSHGQANGASFFYLLL